jgi:hypothetical protein
MSGQWDFLLKSTGMSNFTAKEGLPSLAATGKFVPGNMSAAIGGLFRAPWLPRGRPPIQFLSRQVLAPASSRLSAGQETIRGYPVT